MAVDQQKPDSKKLEPDAVETQVKAIVVDSEYSIGKSNNNFSDSEFQSYLDMFECERTEKNVEWRSDICLPQFFSLIVTQASTDASRFFMNRDFVESYVMDDKRTEESNTDERLINRTLNQKHLYMYQKYMRAKLINYIKGETYARVWWEKQTKTVKELQPKVSLSTTTDVFGKPLKDIETQTPEIITENVSVDVETIVYDRFNFDVWDPRNVFTDNSYCYSLQEKPYVIFRSETSLDELNTEAEQNGYFNLDRLIDVQSSGETETAQETTNLNDRETKSDRTPSTSSKDFDKLERFGKFWVTVNERENPDDPESYPVDVSPGIDGQGEKLENAEFIECLITFIKNASTTVMIGFQAQRCRDSKGVPYRNIIRGIHYIHPTEDSGLGDGKSQKELQIAIDDTFNINLDRTQLAAIPTLKMRRSGNEDNATVRVAPEHVIELENTNDLEELKISDDPSGSGFQIQFLKSMSEQAFAHSPSTMGLLPQDSSVTATAIAGADARANIRDNYKSLTFEHTFENNLYWMISQLTWQYAEMETLEKLVGDKILTFNPDGDYYWKPVSQAIETAYSKDTKIKQLSTMMGILAPVPNPKTAELLNFMAGKALTLMGDEFESFGKHLLDPSVPVEGTASGSQPALPGGQPTSNQNAVPQSQIEQGARENFNEAPA